jgi:hypothetical protein
MGVVNRDLAVRNHSASRHAEQLVGLFERLEPAPDREHAPLRELERLARATRSFEVRAFHLVRENDALRARLEQLDPDFVPDVARPGRAAHGGRRARLRRLSALGPDSVRDRLRWRAWRMRVRRSRSAVPDLAAENELLRRRLELMAVERDTPLTPQP